MGLQGLHPNPFWHVPASNGVAESSLGTLISSGSSGVMVVGVLVEVLVVAEGIELMNTNV